MATLTTVHTPEIWPFPSIIFDSSKADRAILHFAGTQSSHRSDLDCGRMVLISFLGETPVGRQRAQSGWQQSVLQTAKGGCPCNDFTVKPVR